MLSPLKSIRKNCLVCCKGQNHEVNQCQTETCPLFYYRLGKRNREAILTPLKAIRQRCLDCSGFDKQNVRNCWDKECFLYPYRLGKNPNRKSIGRIKSLV